MTDPYYTDMKQHKKDNDWREWVCYVQHCIPKKCVCDAPITLETDDKGTSYYSCKYFEVRTRVHNRIYIVNRIVCI